MNGASLDLMWTVDPRRMKKILRFCRRIIRKTQSYFDKRREEDLNQIRDLCTEFHVTWHVVKAKVGRCVVFPCENSGSDNESQGPLEDILARIQAFIHDEESFASSDLAAALEMKECIEKILQETETAQE
jgi:hypothetical protein